MSKCLYWLLPTLVVAVLAAGCDGTKKGDATPTGKTPAQVFNSQQGNTETPHGKIVPNSAEERDGKMQYRTEDGKKWSVDYSKRADGTYQYGTPAEGK